MACTRIPSSIKTPGGRQQEITSLFFPRPWLDRIYTIIIRSEPQTGAWGSRTVRPQCPLTSSLGKFLGYRDWLWCPIGQNGMDKIVRTKWYGQNGTRTKWHWTKWYGQNGRDKMVRIKYYG